MAPSGGKKGKVDQSPASILKHGDYTVSLTSWLAGGPAVIGKKPRRVLDMKVERDRKSEKSDQSLVLASNSKKSNSTASSDMEVATSKSGSVAHNSSRRRQTESSSSQRVVSSRPFLTYEQERVEKFTVRPPPLVFNNPEDVPADWLQTILSQRKHGESSKVVPKKTISYTHSDSDDYAAQYDSPRSKSKSLSKKSSSSRKPSKLLIETKSSLKKGTRKVKVTTADASDDSDELSSDADSRRRTETKQLEHRSNTKERRKTKKIHIESSEDDTADGATADSESSDIESTTIKLRAKSSSKKKPITSSKKSGSSKVKIETRDKKGKRKVIVEASADEEASSDESMSKVELAPPKKSKSKNRVTVTETTRKGKKKIVTAESSDEGETTHIKSRSSTKGKKSEVHIKAGGKSKTKKVTFESADETENTEAATTDAEPVPLKSHKGNHKDKSKAKEVDKGKTEAKKKVEAESSEAAETTDAVTTEAETTEAATTEAETTDAEVTVVEKPKAAPASGDGWTPSQDAILISMKEGGESWASIAKATGQAKKAVTKRYGELVKSGVAQAGKKGDHNKHNKKEQKAKDKENKSTNADSNETPAAEESFGLGELPGFGGDDDTNSNNNESNGGNAWGGGGDQNNDTTSGGGNAWGNDNQNDNGGGFAPVWGADCTGGDNNNADNNNNGFGGGNWDSGDQGNNGGGNVGPRSGNGWTADCTGGGNSKPPSNAGSKNGSNKLPSNSGNNGWGAGSNQNNNGSNKPPSNNGSNRNNNGGSNQGNKPHSNSGWGSGSNSGNKPPSNNGGSNFGNKPPSNSGNNGWGSGSNQGNKAPSNSGWNNGGSNQGSNNNRPPSNNGGFGSGSNHGQNNNSSKTPSNNDGQNSGSNNGNRAPSNNGDWGGVGPSQNNNSGWGSSSNLNNKPPSNSDNQNNGGSNQVSNKPPSNKPPSNNGNWGPSSNQGNNNNHSNHSNARPPSNNGHANNGSGSNHGGSNNNRPPSNNNWGGVSNQGNSNRPVSNNGDWGNSGSAHNNNANWGSGSNHGSNNYNKPPSNVGSARGSNSGRPPSNNGNGGWGSGSNSGNKPPSNNGNNWGSGSNQGNRPPSNSGWNSGGSNQGNHNNWASGSNHGKPPSNNGGWGSGSNNGQKPPSNNGSNRGGGSKHGGSNTRSVQKDESEKDREIQALRERVSEETINRLEAEVFALKLERESANRLNQNKGTSENGNGMGWNTGGSDKNWKVPRSVAGSTRSNNRQPDGWKSRPPSDEVWENPGYKPASNSGWVPNEIVPPQNNKPPSNRPPSNRPPSNANQPPGSPDGWVYGSPTESEKLRVAEKVESWKGSISPPKEEGRWGTPVGGWPADKPENATDKPRGRSPAARSSASAKNWQQNLARVEEEPEKGYEMWKKPASNSGKPHDHVSHKSSGNFNKSNKPSGEQYRWNSGRDAAPEPHPPRGSQISTPEFKPVEPSGWNKGTRNDKPPSNNGDWTSGLGATAGWMADCTKPPSNDNWAGGSNQGKDNNKAPSLTGFNPDWGMDCTGPYDAKPSANNKPSKGKDHHKNALNIHMVTDLPVYNRDVDIQAPIGLSGLPPGSVQSYQAPALAPYPGQYPATPYSSKGTKTPILPIYNKHTPFYDAKPTAAPVPGPSGYQVGQRSSHSLPPLSESDLESFYKSVVFSAISSGQPLLQPKPDSTFTLRDCWVLIALNDQYDRGSASKEKWFDLQAKFASATGGKKVDAVVLRSKVRQAEKEGKVLRGWEDEEVGWRYKAWRDKQRV